MIKYSHISAQKRIYAPKSRSKPHMHSKSHEGAVIKQTFIPFSFVTTSLAKTYLVKILIWHNIYPCHPSACDHKPQACVQLLIPHVECTLQQESHELASSFGPSLSTMEHCMVRTFTTSAIASFALIMNVAF